MSTLNARRLFWDACWFCNTWGSILVVGAEVVQSVVCVRYVQRSLGINARRFFGDACWFCNTWGSILVVGD